MNQRAKLAAFLGVAFVLAGVALFFARDVQQVDRTKRVQRAHDHRMISPFSVSEQYPDGGYPFFRYEKLEVTFGGETTKLERRGAPSIWWLSAPIVSPANQTAVSEITESLENALLKTSLEEEPDEATLKKYGLAPPVFQVKAVATLDRSVERTVVLKGGVTNTFDETVYVQRNDEKTVYAAPSLVSSTMALSSERLREARVLFVRELDVEHLTVRTPTHAFELARQDLTHWDFVQPTQEPADFLLVSRLLQAVGSEKAVGFPRDTPEMRKALGFDAPRIDAHLELRGEDLIHLRITRVDADGGSRWYGLFESDEFTGLAEFNPSVGAYETDPASLRDTMVLRVDPPAVSQLVLRDAAGAELRLARSVDGGWAMPSAHGAPADPAKVLATLNALVGLKGTPGEAHPDWRAYGLASQAKTVDLLQTDGGVSHLAIGSQVPGRASQVFVRGNRELVLTVEGVGVASIPFSRGEYAP